MPKIQVADIQFFYQDDDFAEPWASHDTVFIQHGFGRNSNFWRAWVPWLAREYRVIRMDLRGCGQSGDPGPPFQYSLASFFQDFFGFLKALNIRQVHYIGESLGGIIGAAAAAEHPQFFKSLTLVSTMVQINKDVTNLFALGYPTWQDALKSLGMKGWWLTLRRKTGELTGNAAADEYIATEFARTPLHVGLALSKFAPTVSLAEILPKITVPTLILTPGVSYATSRQEQGNIAKTIPRVRQKVYEGARHSMYYLIPDTLARDTLEFLRNLR